jgi:hypothetical protein
MTRIVLDLPDDPRPGTPEADLLADLATGSEVSVHVWRPSRKVHTILDVPAHVESFREPTRPGAAMRITRAEAAAAKVALEDRYHRRPVHFADTVLGFALLAACGVTDLPEQPRDAFLLVAESSEEADEWIRLTLDADGPFRVLGPVEVEGQWLYGYDLRPRLAELRTQREEGQPDA